MADRAAILRAWAETRWAMATVRSRAALERRQARLWRRMTPAITATPALAPLAGRPLSDFPVRSPAEIRGDVDRWNSLGISEAEARSAAEAAEATPKDIRLLPFEGRWQPEGLTEGWQNIRNCTDSELRSDASNPSTTAYGGGPPPLQGGFCSSLRSEWAAAEHSEPTLLPGGIAAGFSTGTSGARGLFLASPSERARYVGQALARLLAPAALLSAKRIALCLRADSPLYRDVGAAGRFVFNFVPLSLPPADRVAAIVQFDPHVLIAPPHELAELARVSAKLPSLERLFYGAEPMGDAERSWITPRLGVRPDPVYQATEGFLGAPCQLGILHLNEHDMVLELEPIPGTRRFRPIVTDLRRTTQPIVRIRLDDLIEPLDGPCRCGAVTRAVRPVEGRIDDLWRWDGGVVCPRDVEDVLAMALGADADWRAMAGPSGVVVETDNQATAVAALSAWLAASGIDKPVTARRSTGHDAEPKRRRIRWVSDHG